MKINKKKEYDNISAIISYLLSRIFETRKVIHSLITRDQYAILSQNRLECKGSYRLIFTFPVNSLYNCDDSSSFS